MAEVKAVIFNSGKFQGFNDAGNVVSYGKLYFYESGTGNEVATFTTSTQETKNTFPIILSASGKADVFVTEGQFDVTLLDKNGVNIWTINNFIAAGGDIPIASIQSTTQREEFTGIAGDFVLLENTPITTIVVHKNGLLLKNDDYELEGKVVQFTDPLITTDFIVVEYETIIPGEANQGLTYSVDTIEDMLLLSAGTSTAIVRDTNRGGTFSYDSTQSAVNDGGIIIDGWVREQDDVTNLKWFDAKGDATTNDDVALQAAIDYCNTNSRELFVPKGTYLMNSQITVSEINHLKIRGEDGAILKAGPLFAGDSSMMQFTSLLAPAGGEIREFSIDNIRFDAANIPNSGTGEANDCINVSSNGTLETVSITNCAFKTGDRFETAGGDSHIFSAGANKTIIKGCKFQGAIDAAIYVSGNQTEEFGEDLLVLENEFSFCNVAVINKRTFRRSIVSNNFITNCSIGITQGEGDAGQLTGKYNIISDNVILRTGRAIEARIFNGNTITGNIIREIGYTNNVGTEPTAATGIMIAGSGNNVVSNNVVRDLNPDIATNPASSAYNGIYLLQRSYEGTDYISPSNNISGNVCKDIGAFLLSDGTSIINLISDNLVENSQYAVGLHANNVIVGPIEDSVDYGVFDGTYNRNFIVKSDGKVGIGCTPQRKFHIANGFANGASETAGAEGTEFLLESSVDTVINMVSNSLRTNHFIFGSDLDNDRARISHNNVDNSLNIVASSLSFNSVPMTAVVLPTIIRLSSIISGTQTGTTEHTIVTQNYTMKGDGKKLFVEIWNGISMANYDQVTLRMKADTVQFDQSKFSSQSEDHTTTDMSVAQGGMTASTFTIGQVVSLSFTGQLTVGLGIVYAPTDQYIRVTEID